jgi:hypothetical protein
VTAHEVGGAGAVARDDQVAQLVVLFEVGRAGRAGAADLAQRVAAVAVGAVPEERERARQRWIVSRLPDRRVKRAVRVERSLGGVLAQRLELVGQGLEFRALSSGDARGGEAGRE